MKCKLCNEKKGSTRCEGCGLLLCLQCIHKHQTELMHQFQQLMNTRNELKESIDIVEATSRHENQLLCFHEIDRWEQETIQRIRETAGRIRTSIDLIIAKNLVEIHSQLEQLSTTMEQQQKEENYLENDLERVQLQLHQLKEAIPLVHGNIHVTTSNNVDWNTLIHVVARQESIPTTVTPNQLQTDQDKSSTPKSASRHRSHKQPTFRPATPIFFESNHSESFQPISPPECPQNGSSSSETSSPLIQNIVPSGKIAAMLPTLGQSFTWAAVSRNRQNT